MTKFSDLPTEIWLHIASYLPKTQLFQLKSLNSFFLDCWMNISWKRLIISAPPIQAVKRLQRAIDPFVVTRVKTLAIYFKSLTSEFATLLLSFLPLLHSITHLQIFLSRESSFFSALLFQTISSSESLPRKLQKLQIDGPVDVFTSLGKCSHTPAFENLTELDLSLTGEHWDKEPIQPILVPFLRTPTLRILCVWGLAFDLFALLNQFDSSVPVPNLKSLTLVFPGLYVPRSAYKSAHRFLLTNSDGLQFLRLTVTRFCPNPDVDKLLGTWLDELVNTNIQFPSLRSLKIYPSTSRIGLSALLTLIKRTSPTLSSLTIDSRFLTGEEVDQLVDALTEGEVQVQTTSVTTTKARTRTSNLKNLDIRINYLSVPFLELLARKLPQLEKLNLRVSEIADSPNAFYDLLEQRRYDRRDMNSSPTQDILHTWKLHYISIWKGYEWANATRAVAGALPSVILCGGEYLG